jgi:hypothetical protein
MTTAWARVRRANRGTEHSATDRTHRAAPPTSRFAPGTRSITSPTAR